MAITKTTTIERIECLPPMDSSAADSTNDGNWRLTVFFEDVLAETTVIRQPLLSNKLSMFFLIP